MNYSLADHASFVAYTTQSVAPNAQLYAAHATSGTLEPIEWLIDQGVNVINISLGVGYPTTNEYGTVAKWLDHIALDHYVSIVISAGNEADTNPGEVYEGKTSYNAIVVGSVDVNGQIANSSSYTYMTFEEGSRPDISAPGVDIQPEGMSWAVSGTSLAAPMVTGAVAILCQQDSVLLYYPDAVKAILATNVSASFDRYVTWPLNSTNGYERYGAGILDCLNVYNSLSAEQYYIDGGFDPNTLNARQTFTVELEAGTTARFAIANLRDASVDHSTNTATATTAPKIKLSVLRGSTYYVQTATTYLGNLKIVEFTPTVSGTYTVCIDNLRSISTEAWYSVAWCQID